MTDAIMYWNDVALEANRISHTNSADEQTGPTLSSRALAIVHLAMYDAFVGTSPAAGLTHYLTEPAIVAGAPAGASAEAAVAAAAHGTLSALFRTQKPFFDLKHLQSGLSGTGLQDGHLYGLKVAQAILTARKNDPGKSDDGYAYSLARGAHRPDPDNPAQGFHAPFYGAGSALFAATQRWDLDAPFGLSSPEYLSALQQVRNRGIAPELMGTLPSGSGRSPAETVRGIFWGYDGAFEIGTPPRLYNQIVRELAKLNPVTGVPNTPAENAKLFALVNVAMGDAGILSWEQKYKHDFWRPVVGIREHDPSMGPTGMAGTGFDSNCDPGWLPLGAPRSNSLTMEKSFTPPFPAYPSGHATFGAAAFHITRLFYGVMPGNKGGDTLFQGRGFVSDEFNGVTRDNKGVMRPRHTRGFDNGGLWQMIIENGASRVDLGVHWEFDAFAVDSYGDPDLSQKIGGVRLGYDIAEDIFANFDMAGNSAQAADAVIDAPELSASDLAPRNPWPLG